VNWGRLGTLEIHIPMIYKIEFSLGGSYFIRMEKPVEQDKLKMHLKGLTKYK
jgi:hypothetical protein